MDWKPKEEGLKTIYKLLDDSNNPNSEVQERVRKQLEHLNKTVPDFLCYLGYIFARQTQIPETLRQIAGILLKNSLNENKSNFQKAFFPFIKQLLIEGLKDSKHCIRSTSGTAITAILRHNSLEVWPEVIGNIVPLLEIQDINAIEGAFSALLKICEDNANELCKIEYGQPVKHLIPIFIKYLEHPREQIRRDALLSALQFVPAMPPALVSQIDRFIQGVCKLTNDQSNRIRKYVCRAFVILLDHPNYLQNYIQGIINFMVKSSGSDDEAVALEACEFWGAIGENENCKPFLSILKPQLPSLVPILLKKMIYSEIERSMMEEEFQRPDKDTDIAPHIHKPNIRAADPNTFDEDDEEFEEEEEEDSEDDLEGGGGDWNLRKCSATALDILSHSFGNDILPSLLPAVQERMKPQQPWEVRESAILAIGAVAEGCRTGMEQHLAQLVPYLLNSFLKDPHPIVRSITCWTLSRYSSWIVAQNPKQYFEPVLKGILENVLNRHKKVQEAACSAFSTLEEKADQLILEYKLPVLAHLSRAFNFYQKKNLIILYDAIGTFADILGPHLNNKECINLLMPPLIQKWNSIQDTDNGILPLLECLSFVVKALGVGFQQFVSPVFMRCVRLIENTLMQQDIAEQTHGEYPDCAFICCSIDLMCAITDAFGSSMESLIAESNLLSILERCLTDPSQEVRQSSIGYVGDLAKACIGRLKPVLPKYVKYLINALGDTQISVCNNACWALGEVAVNLGPDFKSASLNVLEKLVPIMNNSNLNVNLLENAAVTIGRIALVSPETVAPIVGSFCKNWCLALRNVSDKTEREHAFGGLCATIRANPHGILPSFAFVCDAIASYGDAPQKLKQEFGIILTGFKKNMGDKWNGYFSQFPPELQEKLRTQYNL